MNISELFVRRPVATSLIMVGIVGAGVIGYGQLPVSDLPNVDFPTINVQASLAGASPETMASVVATPLEKRFSSIPGVDAITSTSSQGNTNITLQFSLDRSIDAAAQDVQSAIAGVARGLPRDMQPPSYSKSNPADQPILYMALTSNSLPLSTVDEYAETLIAQRISTIDGVAQVSVMGAQKYAIRIQLDPRNLASRRIGIDDVVGAVGTSNVNSPTGILWGKQQAVAVQTNGQLQNASAFRDIVITYRNGAPVRLGDLAQVTDGVQDTRSASWYNGVRSITLSVQRQPGTNTVKVATAVRDMMEQLKEQLPPAVQIHYLFDRSQTIRASVSDVKLTLMLTLCLVVLVIFLFLRNVRATVIPSMALPMSVVGTFGVMALLGYSIDNLSMMALTLAVGFVVDDAIVMLENVHRHIEMGKTPMQAALDGSAEVGFTIVSMTLSLAAVFIPVLFMGGLLGRLFHEFAVTIGAAILVSGFVSLTLTPMMCSRLLKPGKLSGEEGRFGKASDRVYQRAVETYERWLHWVMRHRAGTMVFSLAILVGTVFLFVAVPKGFIPTEDSGAIYGTVETLQGTSYDAMLTYLRSLQDIARQDPDIDAVAVSTGSGGPFALTINQGRINLYMKPRNERRAAAEDVLRRMNARFGRVPGVRVFLSIPPSIRVGGRVSKATYQFTLQSPDIVALYHSAELMEEKLRELPSLTDVSTDLQVRNPQVKVEVNREVAAALGVDTDQLENALYSSYGTRQISTIYASNDQYWVMLELLPQFQRDMSALNMVYVHSASGALVPLAAVAKVTPDVGPVTVNHSGQLPSVTLSFNTREGSSLGAAVADVGRIARATLPSGITTTFAGQAQAFQQSQGGLLFLLIVAILVIYLVLGMLYESFIHPITILSALPFATFGALLTLIVFRTDLNIYAYVGMIMLVGLVKKNGIMMIDFALEAQRSGHKAPADAIVEACLIRFRPIMMTTMCALMGTLPIAVGVGAGAEARRPLGIAVVGGLLFSQLITLFVTPVIYTYMDAFQHRLAARAARRRAAGQGPSPEAVLGAAD